MTTLGQVGYEAFSEDRRKFTGKPSLRWDELDTALQESWETAVTASVHAVFSGNKLDTEERVGTARPVGDPEGTQPCDIQAASELFVVPATAHSASQSIPVHLL